MSHSHNHDHSPALTNVNTAFILGISLNILFVIIEAVLGFINNSLSLLSDAGHNLADVGSLALSLLAFKLMKVKSNDKYTYGYRKTSILVALFNSMILLITIGAIVYEAIQRLFEPEPIAGSIIALVAGIGILINAGTALLFLRDKEKDMNIKSAYLHLMSDAIVSLGLVIGGIIIYFTNWYWIDSILSIGVAIVILITTWRLLKQSLRLSLDGVPENIHIEEIKNCAIKMDGIKDLHHIHVWAMSTTENAMTGHLVFDHNISLEQEQVLKNKLKHELNHKNIHHITLETERENEACNGQDC